MSNKKGGRDSIRDLMEWLEHQYNPGYWINRLPPFIPQKRSWGWGCLALIDVFLIIPAFIGFLWLYLTDHDPDLVIVVFIAGAVSVLATLRVFALVPRLSVRQKVKETPKGTSNKR